MEDKIDLLIKNYEEKRDGLNRFRDNDLRSIFDEFIEDLRSFKEYEVPLKFKKDASPIGLSEDFYYMINGGGWCKPEKFLEEQDAKKVRKAIEVIKKYESQGKDEGFFEEM